MFGDRHDGSGTAGNPPSEPWRQLHLYWLSKHVDGRPPARAEIDPVTEIPRLVANMMIIDAGDDDFVYRFVGTGVVEQTGEDMTGRSVGTSRKYASARPTWVAALEFVKRNRQPLLLIHRFGPRTNATHAALLMPLHAASGAPFKILGGSFSGGSFPPGLQVDGLSVQDVPS